MQRWLELQASSKLGESQRIHTTGIQDSLNQYWPASRGQGFITSTIPLELQLATLDSSLGRVRVSFKGLVRLCGTKATPGYIKLHANVHTTYISSFMRQLLRTTWLRLEVGLTLRLTYSLKVNWWVLFACTHLILHVMIVSVHINH